MGLQHCFNVHQYLPDTYRYGTVGYQCRADALQQNTTIATQLVADSSVLLQYIFLAVTAGRCTALLIQLTVPVREPWISLTLDQPESAFHTLL